MGRIAAYSLVMILLASFLAPLRAVARSALVIDATTGRLWDLDLATGQYSNARETGMINPGAIRFDSTGTLYGLANVGLYRINPVTGASTSLGYLGWDNFSGTALAWDAATNTMFGSELVLDTYISRHLLKIDLAAATARIVGNNFVSRHVADMSFDDQGRLWMLQLGILSDDFLTQVNKSTGAIMSSVTPSINLCCTAGMAFDSVTDTMYVVNGGFGDPANLYSINLTNGALTLLSSGSGPIKPSGIAMLPLSGDYNGDNEVSAADYTVWRNSLGQTVTVAGTRADGNRNGRIDQDDYAFWKINYQSNAGAGWASANAENNIPEPATAIIGVLAICLLSRSRQFRGNVGRRTFMACLLV